MKFKCGNCGNENDEYYCDHCDDGGIDAELETTHNQNNQKS